MKDDYYKSLNQIEQTESNTANSKFFMMYCIAKISIAILALAGIPQPEV